MTTPRSHGTGEHPPGGGHAWGPPSGGSHAASSPPGAPPAAQGQYPPPEGQFPQGQYSYPLGQFPAGQFPPGQFPAGQFPPPGATPPEQRPSRGGRWIVVAAGGILALLVAGLLAFAFLGSGDAQAGECLQDEDSELTVVDCDDEDAAWRVVGVQEGQQTFDEYMADPATCQDFASETTQSFWIGENGDETGQGVVYCVTTP